MARIFTEVAGSQDDYSAENVRWLPAMAFTLLFLALALLPVFAVDLLEH